MSEINWSDPSEVGGIVEQFAKSLAIELADAETDGTYDDLVAGYREGRTTFGVKRHGMIVLDDAPVPPPNGN